MTRMSSLRAALAAIICLLPLHAFAQSDQGFDIGDKPAAAAAPTPPPTNWITLGGQYDSDRSFYLNRFTGAVNPGFYGLGDFHIGQRDAWDSGGTNYWDAQGNNLGFEDRSATARVGQQGTWGLTFSYQGIPYDASNEFPSVWTSTGTTVPGVPPGSIPLVYPKTPFVSGVGSINSLWLPTPSSSLPGQLYSYSIGTQRDIFSGTGKYQWGDWTITGAWWHEHKTGYQANSIEIGGTVGLTTVGTGGSKNIAPTTGVTSALGYFAQPVDYDTDRYDVTAAYGNERLQVQLGYSFSNFKDNLSQIDLLNPFALNPTTTFGTSAASLSAPYSLPPSNSAHQVKLMFGYNVSPTMRVNANFAYGLEMQNAPYVVGTGDPINNPIEPRSSFDGLIETIYGNVAMTAQPIPKLDVRLSYTIDDRINESPSNAYMVDTRSNTSTSANGDCTAFGGVCINLPFSFNHQTFLAEASYRILPQTKVTLNDTFETTYRNYADASFVTSNTATAKIRSEFMDDVFGTLSYSHQDRNANNYINNNTWTLLGTSLTEPSGFLMYFEASRRHDEVKATLDLSPTNTLTASLMVKYSNDFYPNDQYGLRNNHNIEVGPDVSWQITSAINAHAYYTYQQIYYDQSSLYVSGTNYGPTGTGYYVPWTAQSTDSVQTFGVTMDWQAIPDVLKISFDYNLSYGDTGYALGDGGALIGGVQTNPATIASLNFQPLPDVKSILNMLQLRGEYTFRPNMTMVFGYAFEKFNYQDFMYTASPTQYANALLPGLLVPNSSIHVLSAVLRYRF
jgi:MtrB/PioB family decaheme-associated outer membrane protein